MAPLFQLHMDFPLVPLNVVQLCPLLPPQVFASSPCNYLLPGSRTRDTESPVQTRCPHRPTRPSQRQGKATASTVATASLPSTFFRLICRPVPLDSALPPRKQHPDRLLKSSRGQGEQGLRGRFSDSCLELGRSRYRTEWDRGPGVVGVLSAETMGWII